MHDARDRAISIEGEVGQEVQLDADVATRNRDDLPIEVPPRAVHQLGGQAHARRVREERLTSHLFGVRRREAQREWLRWEEDRW